MKGSVNSKVQGLQGQTIEIDQRKTGSPTDQWLFTKSYAHQIPMYRRPKPKGQFPIYKKMTLTLKTLFKCNGQNLEN